MTDETGLVVREVAGPTLTAGDIVAHVRLVQQVMKAVMKPDVHYGTIPGCGPKPALLKPGAEKLASVFRLAIEPVIEDLSSADEIRYRVMARATHMGSGVFLGAGIGECSSNEAKYHWRAAVSVEEFAATPENRRRRKYTRKGTTDQVRTEPADIANTVLKMAKKRALVDVVLTVTAASDCFSQDIEDLPEEIRSDMASGEETTRPPVKPPTRKTDKPAAKGEVLEGYIELVEHKTGNKADGTPWNRYGIKIDGVFYGTFSDIEGELAMGAHEDSAPVRLTWKQDGNYRNVVEIERVST